MNWNTSNVISDPCEVKLSVAGPEEATRPVHQTATIWAPVILFVSLRQGAGLQPPQQDLIQVKICWNKRRVQRNWQDIRNVSPGKCWLFQTVPGSCERGPFPGYQMFCRYCVFSFLLLVSSGMLCYNLYPECSLHLFFYFILQCAAFLHNLKQLMNFKTGLLWTL